MYYIEDLSCSAVTNVSPCFRGKAVFLVVQLVQLGFIFEPSHEKIINLGFRPGRTQTRVVYSHRK